MEFFKDEEQAISYILDEIVATLEDDILNQKKNGEPEEDYKELEDKIKDIEKVSFLVRGGPKLLAALEGCLHQMEQMKDMFDDEDGTIEAAMDDAELAVSNAGGIRNA